MSFSLTHSPPTSLCLIPAPWLHLPDRFFFHPRSYLKFCMGESTSKSNSNVRMKNFAIYILLCKKTAKNINCKFLRSVI